MALRVGMLLLSLVAAFGMRLAAPPAARALLVTETRGAMPAMALDDTPRKGLWGPDREPPVCC